MFAVGNAVASAAPFAEQAEWSGQNLPPELSGLKDIPADRFAHFKGMLANLTDKDGKPLSVTVTPGVASNVSSSSITLNGNDGVSHTYTLDAQTMTHGKTLAQGERGRCHAEQRVECDGRDRRGSLGDAWEQRALGAALKEEVGGRCLRSTVDYLPSTVNFSCATSPGVSTTAIWLSRTSDSPLRGCALWLAC